MPSGCARAPEICRITGAPVRTILVALPGMGRVHDGIDAALQEFLERQPLFFVASAPLASEGHVNVSPKGLAGTFRVLNPHRVAYLDLTGSGIETIAHVRENGAHHLDVLRVRRAGTHRAPLGRGDVVTPDAAEYDTLAAQFPALPGARAVVSVALDRIADSCGYGVPRMELVGHRDRLLAWAESKGDAGLAHYRAERNEESIDGLPGY